MSLDGAYLNAIKREIAFLEDGRVEKITQPSAHTLIMFIRAKGGNHRLFFCAEPNAARIALINETPDAPKTPPNFCILLRKHIASGKLTGIRQDGLERILHFDFDTVTELGDKTSFTLSSEMIGKSANVILINAAGKIVDAMRRVDAVTSENRLILPNVTYRPPEKDERFDFRNYDSVRLRKMLVGADSIRPQSGFSAASAISGAGGDISRKLIKIFEGISPVLAREWCFEAFRGETPETLTEEQFERLEFFINKTAKELESGTYSPTVLKTKEGEPKDFSFVNLRQYGNFYVTKQYETASAAVTAFFEDRDRAARLRQRSGDLYKFLLAATERIEGRIAAQRIELEETETRFELKTKGDLIAANLYRIEDGDGSFTCENFYEDGAPQVTIELDRRLSASKNMQKYYNEYKKAETRRRVLTEQIKKGEDELIYIESVFDALSRAESDAEIAVLRAELTDEGYLKRVSAPKYKNNKIPKSPPPIELTTPDGYTVLVGRNNTQNDTLTTKTADKTDLWLHTKNIPGSHVILRTNGTVPPDETILYAAKIAAKNSKAARSSQVPVDVVLARFVKKPNKSKPGMVIFTNNKTVYVNPEI
jgi:predicted ribosome quality control (RQC) complex YloA/Tae2 family protein